MNKNPQKLPYEEFKKIYSKVPRLCVDLLFIKESGILMIERAIDPGKGNWHFPGGTVLMGEAIDDTIRRIAKEETSLEILQYELLGFMEFDQEDNPYFHTVSMVFRINEFEGTLKGGEQGKNLKFHQVLPEKIIPEQKKFLVWKGIVKQPTDEI